MIQTEEMFRLQEFIKAYEDLYQLLTMPNVDERESFGALARHCTEHIKEYCPNNCDSGDEFFFTPTESMKVVEHVGEVYGYSVYTIATYANFFSFEKEVGYVVVITETGGRSHQYIIWERPLHSISQRANMFRYYYQIDHCLVDITSRVDSPFCILSLDDCKELPVKYPREILPQFRYLNRISPSMTLLPEFEYLRDEHPTCIPSKIR